MAQALNSIERVKINSNDGALGAEILGLDISQCLSADIISLINRTLSKYSLLIFRSQSLTDDDQIRFTEYFGKSEIHIRDNPDVETPGIFLVSNVLKDGKPIGALGNDEIGFHSDLSYLPKPGLYSTLYAIEIPSKGGSTQWCNNAAAYETLDSGTKEQIHGLYAIHQHFNKSLNPSTITTHPIVCTHPITKHKYLFITPLFTKSIVNMDPINSKKLLNKLFKHMLSSQFIWTHHRKVKDLVIWDNRPTMHRREPFSRESRRIMKRTQTFCQEAPIAQA